MSKIALSGNASGTGTFSIVAPNSNTDRTLTLPDEAGTVLTDTDPSVSGDLTFNQEASGSPYPEQQIKWSNDSTTANGFYISQDSDRNGRIWHEQGVDIKFGTTNTERMRLDYDGNLLINNAVDVVNDTAIDSNGKMIVEAPANGYAAMSLLSPSSHSAGNGVPIVALHFCSFNYKNPSQSGVYYRMLCENGNGTYSDRGQMHFVAGYGGDSDGGTAGVVFEYGGSIRSDTDNYADLGGGSFRWDDVYATNGTINTSDRNDKQDIEELSEAEQRVAVACKGLLRKFRWKDAVADKGDDARIHFGIIAQDLQAAFEAEGLDAGRYAMFTSNTWWEIQEELPAIPQEVDEEGNIIAEGRPAHTRTSVYETAEEAPESATERTRLGVRYSELLAFIIGAL